MSTLIVSSFPPQACGIAKYAEQQAVFLRRQGMAVEVFSPPGGGGDWRAPFDDGLFPWRLLRLGWAYRQLMIHFTPAFYFRPGSAWARWATSLGFLILMLALGRRITILIHETEFRVGGDGRPGWRARLDRWWWRLAGRLAFHSGAERDAFARYYRLDPTRRTCEIWPHDQFMTAHCPPDREAARRRLQLEPEALLLLSIGFIQPHKGFERVLTAMGRVRDPRLRYKVVGSVRLAWDVAHAYARGLHELAEADARCEILEGYLSDELFDLWLAAADYIVVPYHEIWSSGVAARARLLGRPLIATRAGGLAEQLVPGSFLFEDEEELVKILEKIAAVQSRDESAEQDIGGAARDAGSAA